MVWLFKSLHPVVHVFHIKAVRAGLQQCPVCRTGHVLQPGIVLQRPGDRHLLSIGVQLAGFLGVYGRQYFGQLNVLQPRQQGFWWGVVMCVLTDTACY